MDSILNSIPSKDLSEMIFVLGGLLGMISHFYKKKYKNETNVDLKAWFTTANPGASLYTAGTFCFAVVTAFNTGIIVDNMTVFNALYIGMTTGWAIDSGMNSDGT